MIEFGDTIQGIASFTGLLFLVSIARLLAESLKRNYEEERHLNCKCSSGDLWRDFWRKVIVLNDSINVGEVLENQNVQEFQHILDFIQYNQPTS